MKLIGDDRQAAIDWLQDELNLTRPMAEGAMISLLKEKIAITTDKGIFLKEEEEEEAKVKAKKFSQRMNTRNKKRSNRNVRKLEKQPGNKTPPKEDKEKDEIQ